MLLIHRDLRNRDDQIGRAQRRGRQYWRQIAAALTDPFHFAGAGQLVAWSRLLLNQGAHLRVVHVELPRAGMAIPA